MAQRVAEIETRLRSAEPRPSELSDEALAKLASRIYRARRRRARYWSAELLGEPAWDMLLDLFVATVAGRKLRTISVCLASHSPGTTGLRWLSVLEKHRLVERRADVVDGRVRLVTLTTYGFCLMRNYLTEALEAGELAGEARLAEGPSEPAWRRP